jgi:hypothetical protein
MGQVVTLVLPEHIATAAREVALQLHLTFEAVLIMWLKQAAAKYELDKFSTELPKPISD